MKPATIAIPVIVLTLVGIAIYSITRDGRFFPAPEPTADMEIASLAFLHEGMIPAKYTCDAPAPVSPALTFSGVPAGAASLALIVTDPDVPTALRPDGVFDHWVLFNIPTGTTTIPEAGSAGTKGANGSGAQAYAAPCPPPQYQPSEHRYLFDLYALDTTLDLPAGATKAQVLAAMEGHVLETAELIGRYDRAK